MGPYPRLEAKVRPGMVRGHGRRQPSNVIHHTGRFSTADGALTPLSSAPQRNGGGTPIGH
ncbi:uncharacterized protein CPUR_06237 [Claviceps purpurea 20.1]|uniref:Uncharacterized protein n=1 Tax=Claviceps purpurea (strain 20.1) TaxID=1111077 RepID=M1VX44_CLAP2|nr:uncharacterized protein CPUR_06237 [Claviceps purpurea 20.1]